MSDFNTSDGNSAKVDFLKLDADTKRKLDAFNQKKARNMSIAVFLYIFSIAFLIFFAAAVGAPIIGVTGMFICIAAATGLIVYTKSLVPVDLISYVKGAKMAENKMADYRMPDAKTGRLAAFFKLYWMLVTIIYLGVSFWTGRWAITWLIWLIAAAVKEAIYLFAGAEEDEE